MDNVEARKRMKTRLGQVLEYVRSTSLRHIEADVTIGVSEEGATALSTIKGNRRLLFSHADKVFRVSPLEGLEGDSIALVF